MYLDGLRDLYGGDIIPADILAVLNHSVHPWKHVARQGEDVREIRGVLHRALVKHLLIADEKPIVTRFWTFGICVKTLLLLHLLGAPSSFLHMDSVAPSEANQKRLEGFKRWYDHVDTPAQLRSAVMCLELTSISTSLSSQKDPKTDDHVPTLVMIGRGS